METDLPRILKDAPAVTPKARRIARQAADEAALNGNGAYRLHVYHAYHDMDFKTAVSKLRKRLEVRYYKDISLNVTGEHLHEEDKLLIKKVADRFCITEEDLRIFADGWYGAGSAYGSDPEDFGGIVQSGYHGLCYHIGPRTTLDDMKRDWFYIEVLREEYYGKRKTKRKAPENHELIYAIFKARARERPLKFSEIYKLYTENRLAGYTKRVNKDNLPYDEASFARYFRKYQPSIKTDT